MALDIIYAILSLFAGIGIFLIGIKMLSSVLKQNSTHKMRAIFKKIGNNRFSGLAIGVGTTAIIQSSTAVTVMTVGLVNVGVLTLFQATAIIMGANIGTTTTSLIVGLSGLNIKYFFMALAFVGVFIKMLAKKDRTKMIADILISIGVLFVGLDIMSSAFKNYEPMRNFFMNMFEKIDFPLLLILIGLVFTVITQSSSASNAIYISMAGSGILRFESAIFLVLGTEVGTTLTAVLASISASRVAKRAALTHTLYNTFNMIMYTSIIWPLLGPISRAYGGLISDPVWQISLLPLIINTLSVSVLIWFIKPINKLMCFLIKDKPNKEEAELNNFANEQLIKTPAFAIEQAIKGINYMGELAKENIEYAFAAFVKNDFTNKERLIKQEEKINTLMKILSEYMIKISSSAISSVDQKICGTMHHVLNDLERIGDQAIIGFESAVRKKDAGIVFSDMAVQETTKMLDKVLELFKISIDSDFLNGDFSAIKAKSKELKIEIDGIKVETINGHIERLKDGVCTTAAGEFYSTIVAMLQSATDHLFNINRTLGRLGKARPKKLEIKEVLTKE